MGKVLVSCKNISVNYDGAPALENVTFSVCEGDYICIAGENGSGKSTLLKAILGLHPIAGGEIIFDKKLSRREIGYLPQQLKEQNDFPAKVMEVVISGLLNRSAMKSFFTKSDKAVAREKMKLLGIEGLENHSYRELSGGQKQRVILARALCAAGRLLLLDEPVTGLDPLVSSEMYSLIGQLNRKTGLTVLMVSHDVKEAVRFAGKVLHLSSEMSFFGGAADYLKSDIGKKFCR